MSHDSRQQQEDIQSFGKEGQYLRQFVGLRFGGGKNAQIGVVAVVSQCAQPAAQGDADAAAVAFPGVAFLFGQAVAGAVNGAVGVDVQMVIVIDLSIAACRPVQIDLRDAAPGCLRHNGDLCE